jgi:hypothetical protein
MLGCELAINWCLSHQPNRIRSTIVAMLAEGAKRQRHVQPLA